MFPLCDIKHMTRQNSSGVKHIRVVSDGDHSNVHHAKMSMMYHRGMLVVVMASLEVLPQYTLLIAGRPRDVHKQGRTSEQQFCKLVARSTIHNIPVAQYRSSPLSSPGKSNKCKVLHASKVVLCRLGSFFYVHPCQALNTDVYVVAT